MTIDELRTYIPKKALILALDQEIEAAYHAVSSPAPKGVIAGKTSVRLAGDPTASALDRVEHLRLKKDQIIKDLNDIEDWVDQVEDPTVSAIIRLHYLAGKSWRETATKLFGYASSDTPRKIVRSYFKRER